ncbi:MAG: PAS domain-containing protein [Spirochaetales bacterium]|nr:PAS domain-containing protein [Spirochaetales bacterium]
MDPVSEHFFNPPPLLSFILDSMAPGIMFIDTEYNILFMNKEKRDNNPHIKTGMKCYDVFEEYGMRCPFCVAARAMENKSLEQNKEYISIQKGVELPVHLSITVMPVLDEKGKVIGAVEIAYDVENLYQTNKRLERLNKEYEHVIYALSHDLRAPLVSIEGFLSKLERKKLVDIENPETIHCLDRIHVNVRMMNNLVKVLLDTSRIATGSLEIQENSMEEIIQMLINNFNSKAESQNAVLNFDFKQTHYRCDRIRLIQVFSNLINNCLEHCKLTENLVIHVGMDDGVFWVKDNGPGIPEDFQEKAFEAFSQASRGGADHFGMGMNIVYKIIQKHGGHVWIENNHFPGTLIKFTLRPSVK